MEWKEGMCRQRCVDHLALTIVGGFTIVLFLAVKQPWAILTTRVRHPFGIFEASNCTLLPCSSLSVWQQPGLAPPCLVCAILTMLAMLLIAMALMVWIAPLCCQTCIFQIRHTCCKRCVRQERLHGRCPETIWTLLSALLLMTALLLWLGTCEASWIAILDPAREEVERTFQPWFNGLFATTIVMLVGSTVLLIVYQQDPAYRPILPDEGDALTADALPSSPPTTPKKKSKKKAKTVDLEPL